MWQTCVESEFQSNAETSTDDRPEFPGSRASWTDTLQFVKPDLYDGVPVYRVMDRKGQVIKADQDPNVIFSQNIFYQYFQYFQYVFF